jgi:hypothetical protein
MGPTEAMKRFCELAQVVDGVVFQHDEALRCFCSSETPLYIPPEVLEFMEQAISMRLLATINRRDRIEESKEANERLHKMCTRHLQRV